MENKKVTFLTDNEGNPSSTRLMLVWLFGITMFILVLQSLAEVFKEGFQVNSELILILLCMVFFPKLVSKVIELKFPGLKNMLKGDQ